MIHQEGDNLGRREFFSNGVLIDKALSYVNTETGEVRGYDWPNPAGFNESTRPKTEVMFFENVTVEYVETCAAREAEAPMPENATAQDYLGRLNNVR